MRAAAALLFLVACTIGASDALGQQLGAYERTFGTIKFLDAYFGTPDEKLEVRPGDSNVPLTVAVANVSVETITGIRGQLSLPLVLSAPDGSRSATADAVLTAGPGDTFYLTFFVNVSAHAQIDTYEALVSVDYSRLRESGTRNEVFDFEFDITGDTVINASARDRFITSLRDNTVLIDITNTGTAALSGVVVSVSAEEIDSSASMQQSMTNMENVVFNQSSWDLGNIGAGSSKTVTVDAYVPGTLGSEVLRVPLAISYINAQGDAQSVTRVADFYVRGFIDARIYDVGVTLIGNAPSIIGEIINEGNENALFGFVTIVPLAGSNISETTQFIDEIETDSPVPFNVPVEFDGEPRYGEHEIRVDVRYKDSIREETVLSYEATIDVPAPESEASEFDPALPVILFAAIAAGFIIWRRRSRRAPKLQ